MAFWSRLRQSKLKFHLFSKEFKRCYTQNHGPIVANQHIASRTLIPVLNKPNFIVHGSQLEFLCKVRFYAAPVQASPKKEERDTSGPRLNEQITASAIRLVTDEGHFLISSYEALARAKSLKLDLVEVDRHAKPPVCKIFDYNKEKYKQQTKEKERAKSKSTLKKGPCKEVRFAAKIKQKDLQIKADMVKRLMESGYRVKCTAIEPTEDVDLDTLLSRFSALIEDVAIVESEQKVENKQAILIVRHAKFGPSKKGSGKKASKAAVTSQLEDSELTMEAGQETEHVDSEELLDEYVQTRNSSWPPLNGDDNIHRVFDLNGEENQQPKSSRFEQSANPTGPPPYSVDRNRSENRYARDPRAGKSAPGPTDMNGRGTRNTMNTPQIPNQGKQPQFSIKGSPQVRPTRQTAYEASKQDSSSPTKSYGIFSSQQVNSTSDGQSAPAGNNRYRKDDPSDPARNPSTPHRNPPPRDSRMSRGPGLDNPGQGRWGRFSSDNSNMMPNKKNESQAEFQRR